MSITTRGWGTGAVTTLGWGGQATTLPGDLYSAILETSSFGDLDTIDSDTFEDPSSGTSLGSIDPAVIEQNPSTGLHSRVSGWFTRRGSSGTIR